MPIFLSARILFIRPPKPKAIVVGTQGTTVVIKPFHSMNKYNCTRGVSRSRFRPSATQPKCGSRAGTNVLSFGGGDPFIFLGTAGGNTGVEVGSGFCSSLISLSCGLGCAEIGASPRRVVS